MSVCDYSCLIYEKEFKNTLKKRQSFNQRCWENWMSKTENEVNVCIYHPVQNQHQMEKKASV